MFWHFSRLLVMLLTVGCGPAAAAQVSSHAAVSVAIRVDPIANVSFPGGTHFVIFVPPPICWPKLASDVYFNAHGCSQWWQQWWPPIPPVRIPFVVTSNAQAVVSAKPEAFLRIWSGRYLGEAVQPGHGALGYHMVVHFPAPNPLYHWQFGWNGGDNWNGWGNWAGFGQLPSWSRVAQLSGADGAGTPPLAANLINRGGTAFGVIYLVATNSWTPTGRSAEAGNYYGRIDVTVTATQ